MVGYEEADWAGAAGRGQGERLADRLHVEGVVLGGEVVEQRGVVVRGAVARGRGGGGAAGAAINRWQNDDVPIKFRPSPFYRVEKSLSPPVTLFKADPGDRKVATVNFALTEAQRTLINKAK